MRDLDRLQDVVEYRIRPSQIRLAFLGVLAAACAIFAVGVTVGKRLEPTNAAISLDPLAQLDRATQAKQSTPPEQEEHTPLTYHNELTKRTKRAEPAQSSETSAEQTPQKAPEASSKNSTPAAQQPEAQPAPASDEQVQEEEARPERPAPGESSVFTLQVGTFETRAEAQAFAADLRSHGHSVFIIRTNTPQRGTWYRVRVGPFHSRREATQYQARFERQERLPTFLVQRRRR